MANQEMALSLAEMIGLRAMIINFGAPKRYWTEHELSLFEALDRAIAAAKQ